MSQYRFPIVHVVCKNSKDIQLAVRFARKYNLHVTIKSSGFDLWGRSTAHSSYGINLMEMKYISVNPNATARSEHGEVTVETGLNSRQVYEEVTFSHYENLTMQYTEIFLALKIEKIQLKKIDIFLIFAQNIDCGYTLEPPRRGGSNEYPQYMFWSKNKKNRFTPAYPSFAI